MGGNLSKIMPMTYRWVFNDVTLTEEAMTKLNDQSCGLASTMQTLQEISEKYTYGTTDAYMYIFNTSMSPGCTTTYCPCKGVGGDDCDDLCKDDYCDDTAVELFCGSGGKAACDPSQFLCKRTDGFEVGYVRAYLQMFLDCNPLFQGNGCSSGTKAAGDCVEEFVVVPNPSIQEEIAAETAQILELVSDMPEHCTPDN